MSSGSSGGKDQKSEEFGPGNGKSSKSTPKNPPDVWRVFKKGEKFSWGGDISRGKTINERREFGPGNEKGGRSSPYVAVTKKKIKEATLANKKYNVGTSTAADPGASPALSSLLGYGGGGGGYYEGTSGGNGGFSLSDIPSIVWIILAVGAGYWLIKSGGKGKKLF